MMPLETSGPLIALQLIANGRSVDLVGLIDTGSRFTFIDIDIAKQLALTTPKTVRVTTVAEQEDGCVCLPFAMRIADRWVSFTNGFAIPMRKSVGYLALVGRDVLARARMNYNGCDGTCALTFAA